MFICKVASLLVTMQNMSCVLRSDPTLPSSFATVTVAVCVGHIRFSITTKMIKQLTVHVTLYSFLLYMVYLTKP